MGMRIAVLSEPAVQDLVFDESHWSLLTKLGQVVRNDQAGKPETETLKRLLSGADVAITSWGCPALANGPMAEAGSASCTGRARRWQGLGAFHQAAAQFRGFRPGL